MARIVGYIATSLDGFIADRGERLDWLDEYGEVDYGQFSYDKFIENIGTTVMGRTTYDWVRRETKSWPYTLQHTIVVTSHPLDHNAPENVSAWHDGIPALAEHLRELPGSLDVWIAGGGKLLSALVDLGAVDYLELYIMPILIGGGTPLWPGSDKRTALELDDARHIKGGVVRLAYKRSGAEPG